MAPLVPARKTPRISVLLPAYNAVTTLPACVSSILRQRESSWECVLVDDGSTDGSLACARRFADRDPRVRVLSAPHRGLVAALNTGLDECRGRFVARMDADDLMHRSRLQEQADLLEARKEWSGLGCHVRMFPRSGLGPGDRAYEMWINEIRSAGDVEREAFVECPLAHPTWMFRREALTEHGYRDTGWPEDYDVLLRAITAGARLGILPRRRLAWRHGPQRLSRRSAIYGDDRFIACKARYLARSFLARTERYVLWGYGPTGRRLSRALRDLGKTPCHIVELHRGRLGQRIHGAQVISPDRLAAIPRRPLVVCVARAGPRGEIRRALAALGFEERRDFVCAA